MKVKDILRICFHHNFSTQLSLNTSQHILKVSTNDKYKETAIYL